MIPDNLDLFAKHDREQQEAMCLLPTCEYCGEKIQDDYCFKIDDEVICEECMNEHFRVSTTDLMG